MLTTMVAAVVVSAAYGFQPSTVLDYKVDVVFDGFLPILGGNEGKAEVGMAVRVNGLAAEEGALRASNEMTAFTIKFNGASLPLTLENAVEYFPKTTVSLTPQGKITKSDAPNISLPVKLPGLDVKRFPDITYLPVELPVGGMVEGQPWTFTKSFGDADLVYTCQLEKVAGSLATIGVTVKQEYTVFENDFMEVVKERADAVAEVKTVMNGKGTVVFDTSGGFVRSVKMANASVSTGKTFEGGEAINRRLDSTLNVVLTGPGSVVSGGGGSRPAVVDRSPMGQLRALWGSAVKTGQELWATGEGWLMFAQMGIRLALGILPGDLGRVFGFGGR